MKKINLSEYNKIVFFTGAGMSAESGVPTYRGKGGIWKEYSWQEFACQKAFDKNPGQVISFHEKRRAAVAACTPHQGHFLLAQWEPLHPSSSIVTQNIDGMHQRAGSRKVIELHGNLFRNRCQKHGISEASSDPAKNRNCAICGEILRPDIVWFEDMLDESVIQHAADVINECDLFVSIGTSGMVWPAAGFPELAAQNGALLIEINPELTDTSFLYYHHFRGKASIILTESFIFNKNL